MREDTSKARIPTTFARLRHDSISLPGVRKIVSDDDAFLVALARAEIVDSLRLAADSVSFLLCRRCSDPSLRDFARLFRDFAESGADPNRWAMAWKDMDAKAAKKMDRYVAVTTALRKEMDQLSDMETGLRKLIIAQTGDHPPKMTVVSEMQQKVFWQEQEVKYLKETSLWGKNFDAITLLLARSAFTVLSRIKHVFGWSPPTTTTTAQPPPCSAAVHPSADEESPAAATKSREISEGFFKSSAAALRPPAGTLGAAALAQHYANVMIAVERMVRSPRSIGVEARDEIYAMLPASLRGLLRRRLRGIGGGGAADAGLAEEWRVALARIAEWMVPLAHNTVRWQAERSFDSHQRRSAEAQPSPAGRAHHHRHHYDDHVLLLQTLHFASREKAEAAIVEMLVGLNYVWRFEMERIMAAKAAVLALDHCQLSAIN